ncbi:hypothetical protein Tco_1056780 [Tanacetum coccineum]|uniref:Uncharacterized protein n=1 Tax=Tanacetum coccineum TaxID=301880 RepID=A0ABQ5H3N2_9ASTR
MHTPDGMVILLVQGREDLLLHMKDLNLIQVHLFHKLVTGRESWDTIDYTKTIPQGKPYLPQNHRCRHTLVVIESSCSRNSFNSFPIENHSNPPREVKDGERESIYEETVLDHQLCKVYMDWSMRPKGTICSPEQIDQRSRTVLKKGLPKI